MKIWQKALAATGLGLSVLAAGAPANAVHWGTVHVTEGGGVVQGSAYGEFYDYRGTAARNDSWQQDARSGGDAVYVNKGWAFYHYVCDSTDHCGDKWEAAGHASTSRTTSSTWKKYTNDNPLWGDATRARTASEVCEDQAFQPDNCGNDAIASFLY